MNLNQVKLESNWGDAVNTINKNNEAIGVELVKVASATTKFKGFFTSEDQLKESEPLPKIGYTAWVGATYPGVVYNCTSADVWTNTGIEATVPELSVKDELGQSVVIAPSQRIVTAELAKKDEKIGMLEVVATTLDATKAEKTALEATNASVATIQVNVDNQLQEQDVQFQAKAADEFKKNKDYVDGKSIEILPESVTPETLSPATKQLIGASGGGTINNLPDDEDLEAAGEVLKFKDKAYQPQNFSGLGRKILRKNITPATARRGKRSVGKNILTQEMVSQPNTVYEIRYDYDLDGATITMPEGCSLHFEGGSISNGTIVGNNTKVVAFPAAIFGNISFLGDFSIDKIYIEWFNASSCFINSNNNDTEAISSPLYRGAPDIAQMPDCSDSFNAALQLNTRSGGVVQLLSRYYMIRKTVRVPMKTHLAFNADTAVFVEMSGEGKRVLSQDPDTSSISELETAIVPVDVLAPNKLLHTDTMAVAFEIFPQQTKISGRGTISLIYSRYTIGLLVKGTGFHFLDMSYGTPDIDVRVVGGKPDTYACDERDLIGTAFPESSTGSDGEFYWDKSTKTYYQKLGGAWNRLGNIGDADNLFNVGLRIDVGQGYGSGRLINPQMKFWHMFGWRGIELYTHDGGWFNESAWHGTVSNVHGSFVSIFTDYDVVSHDMSAMKFQTDSKIQYDARIFQCIRGGDIMVGPAWDMQWIQVKLRYAFYLGKFTRNISLKTIDRYKFVKDKGVNNHYELNYNDNSDPIVAASYRNVLKYRTPFQIFGGNLDTAQEWTQIGWCAGRELQTDPMQLFDICVRQNVNNTQGYPKLLFDEDYTTMIDVINPDTGLYYTGIALASRSSNITSAYTKVSKRGAILIEYVYNRFAEKNPNETENKFPFYVMACETTSSDVWENTESNNGSKPFYNLYELPTSFGDYSAFGWGNMVRKFYIPIKPNAASVPYLIFFTAEGKTDASMQLINIKFISDSVGIAAHTKDSVASGVTSRRPDACPTGHVYYDVTLGQPVINVGNSSRQDWKTLHIDQQAIKGTTAQRPTLTASDASFQYYDTTLRKYICWSGSVWTNLDGTTL